LNRYSRWLPRLIGPVLLVYFLLITPTHKILANLRELAWAPFLLSLALYPVFVTIKAWRWNLLMRQLHLQAPPLGYSISLYMIGVFMGASTPGQTGDFIKAWYLRERGQPLAPALFSIVLDRLFDFLIMALLSLLGLITFLAVFPQQLQRTIQIATIGFAIGIALVIPALMARRPRERLLSGVRALVPQRERARLDRWREQFAVLEMRPTLMGKLLLATLGSATATMGRLWLLFRALDITIFMPALIAASALIAILQTLPISFSGIGVRDAILIPVLGRYGYGPDRALALSALFLMLNVEHVLLGFLVSLRHPLGSANPPESARLEMVPAKGLDPEDGE
jgi:glycosyltransferase 2 family protein